MHRLVRLTSVVCAVVVAACTTPLPGGDRLAGDDGSAPPFERPAPRPQPDSGPPTDAAPGVPEANCEAERCNRSDDDCDGRTDEDTVADCERIMVNAAVQCAPFGNGARCVLIECLDGYDNCDGNPANGCEQPYCACNPCEDAGAEHADWP